MIIFILKRDKNLPFLQQNTNPNPINKVNLESKLNSLNRTGLIYL